MPKTGQEFEVFRVGLVGLLDEKFAAAASTNEGFGNIAHYVQKLREELEKM